MRQYASCNAVSRPVETGFIESPMRTDLFDFDLPEERIALRPVSPRDAAKLLVVRPGAALRGPQRA